MEKKQAKKNAIIDASINLMNLKGYNGTSVKDITDAAGIPKGSFYNHFADKEQYAVDALYYYDSVLSIEFSSILTNLQMQPLDRIRGFFKLGIERLKQQDDKVGCFVGNITQEMGKISLPIAEAAARIHHNRISLIHKNLVEASDNNQLQNKIDLKALADFIMCSWHGAMLMAKVTNNEKVMDDFYKVLNRVLLT